MRLEHIPIILGVIVALIGAGFIADAGMADRGTPSTERRRRMRAERHRLGEALVGAGTLGMAAALLGRDTWRYGTLSILAGAILLTIGIVLNRGFLKEAFLNRGPARRAESPPDTQPPASSSPPATPPERRTAPRSNG